MWQNAFALFAQAAPVAADKAPDWYQIWWVILLLLLGVIVFSCMVGKFLGRKFRMQDYWWKIALILGTVGCATVIVTTGWPPRYGVDLKGGVTLIYEIKDTEEDIDIRALVQALKRRINPSGTKEIVLRPYGEKQVEIIVPDLSPQEVQRLKDRLEQAGVLKFRIVANTTDHQDIIDLAQEQLDVARYVLDADGKTRVGFWADVGTEEQKKGGALKVDVRGETLRDPKSKNILNPPSGLPEKGGLEKWLKEKGYVDNEGLPFIQVLMWTGDGYDVEGAHLSTAVNAADERGNPSVSFTMSGKGARLMGGLTGDNLPEDTGHSRRLGIVLDGVLLSAPNIRGHITTNGEITGRFTNQEVDDIVSILRAGKLPTTLKPQPLSEAQIDAVIGREMREKGIYAIGVSLLAVLVFMVFYYRFSGIVACYALLANLVMIVALIMLVKQPFTLTGLAGLVLTVGMSVDANVLIFERIREEVNRGSALRMAIRNGFGRATTTIVDANLTTLITALVLYAIGTDQIRGFAVALILGILMSMFTAIFCSRVIFDIGERQRWITKLGMMRILGETKIDFIGKRRIAAVFSILLIVVGLVAVVMRGKGIFAIDLAGGSSVRMVLKTPMDTDEVRRLMTERLNSVRVDGAKVDLTVNHVDLTNDGFKRNTVFKIDTSIPIPEADEDKRDPNAPVLADIIQEVFKGKLEMYEIVNTDSSQVTFRAVKKPSDEDDDPPPDAPKGRTDTSDKTDGPPTGPEPPKTPEKAGPSDSDGARRDLPSDTLVAVAEIGPSIGPLLVAQPSNEKEKTDEEPPKPDEQDPDKSTDDAPTVNDDPPTVPPLSEPSADPEPTAKTPMPPAEPADDEPQIAVVDLEFRFWIKPDTLSAEIADAAARQNINYIDAESLTKKENLNLTILDEVKNDVKGAKKWRVELKVNKKDDARRIFDGPDGVKAKLAAKPYFRGESGVGSQIAGDTQVRAIAALLASLIGIIIYIWIRFQKVVFGLAAVVALVHDVLVVLGAIAVSYWLAGALGFMGIQEFKISLPVVAAFLTIIGYSLNDTIVVFDRIREVRGKSPELTGDMINRSIGQTLSRTILTSLTTFLVVAILYGWGGDAIHGFAFALVIGVLVGTYSSIFVASPSLLWMINRGQKAAKGKPA